MTLLTPVLREALRANAAAYNAALREGWPDPDPVPLVKFFNPRGFAIWIATELADDGDTLFGLADLGLGLPELRSFSLAEIAGVRLASGRRIVRDLTFATPHSLSTWFACARSTGSIFWAEMLLRHTAQDEELPPP